VTARRELLLQMSGLYSTLRWLLYLGTLQDDRVSQSVKECRKTTSLTIPPQYQLVARLGGQSVKSVKSVSAVESLTVDPRDVEALLARRSLETTQAPANGRAERMTNGAQERPQAISCGGTRAGPASVVPGRKRRSPVRRELGTQAIALGWTEENVIGLIWTPAGGCRDRETSGHHVGERRSRVLPADGAMTRE